MESDKTKAAGTSTAEATKTAVKKSTAGSRTTTSQNGMTGNSSGNRDYSQEATKEGALYKFFLDGLKDMYFAEKHILEALPKMKEAATTEDLQDAFEDHHLVTQKQVSRLEKVFKSIGESPEAKKCDAIIGIVKEGENIIKETEEGTMTRDAALIIAAQKVEHYEIASYGGLVALAETLQLDRAADLLHQTLEEEEETDLDLTDIAESSINFRAADEEDDEEEDEDDDMD
ncbi:ferritin-like domain-containing protein [Chryseobacterium sp. HSC-36S06]|uniref:ferritin-like domain-containing protein n=1 Tax=Chryseobacterium sp. HSC-36S06 TaxID=2910970 RepID=UPI00209EF69E|nr:ferritin-like domain-containing protein [Chryseobacterium sp. HSC-36S06]MCP2038373.1 ferritin-like metal-binding protein YciE [Chryseobacterium sp. HSC-36S06]